jgi:hypothetical protein
MTLTEDTMADTRKNPESSSHLSAQSRRTALLKPWLLILGALNLTTLITAGIVSNSVVDSADLYSETDSSGTITNRIWWLWLLLFAASVAFLGWRLLRPFRLDISPDGIEYRHGRLGATYKWSEISSLTVAPKRHLLGYRQAVCLQPADNLGPEVAFAQHLSHIPTTPPFRDATTGWIVLCYLNQFTLPAADIDAALTHFAGHAGTPAADTRRSAPRPSSLDTRRGHATIGRPATTPWLFPGGRPGQPLGDDRLGIRLQISRTMGSRRRRDTTTESPRPRLPPARRLLTASPTLRRQEQRPPVPLGDSALLMQATNLGV